MVPNGQRELGPQDTLGQQVAGADKGGIKEACLPPFGSPPSSWLVFSKYVTVHVNEDETLHADPGLGLESSMKIGKVVNVKAFSKNKVASLSGKAGSGRSPTVLGNVLNTFQTIKSHQAVHIVMIE